MPLAMPWTWATEVPAGFMVSAGVGVGDLTSTSAFDIYTGTTLVQSMDLGATIPAFIGYRLHVAPMFAVGGYFQWQFHEVHTQWERAGYSNGEGFSLHGGVKLRVYFPLGLLEPYVGFGAGYAYARQRFNVDWNAYQFERTLQGLMLPLEVGLDVVILSFLTAGLSFQYGFGLWQEWCETNSRPGSVNHCPEPGDDEWPTDLPDSWTFDFHVTFYVR